MSTKVIIILCFIIILNIHPCTSLCIELERQALLKIEKDIYDPNGELSSWRKGGDYCNWHGITCDDTTGHVIQLDLSDLDNSSSIDAKVDGESKLNPSLVDLKHLTFLDLSYDNFRGPIPDFIGSLTSLESLNMVYSGFEGTIPPQLGNLSRLQYLFLGCSSCSVDNLLWLSRLTSLTYLIMDSVNLSAAVDWVHDITKLPFISTISLAHNGLSNIPMTLPSSNNFTSLQLFELYGNPLNSTIPSWLFYNISNLESLELKGSGLYGELPIFHGQVNNLISLNLGSNEFDGQVFRHLDKLPLLEYLDISSNNVNASLPDNLWNLTRLRYLDLHGNQIHGSLPIKLGNHSQLEMIDISLNNITGKIPDSIGNLKKLCIFTADKNLLSGEIPDSFSNRMPLSSLSLSNNNISGRIPKSLADLKYLTYVDLSNNRLSGSEFHINQSSLQMIDLSENLLSDMLPFFLNKSSQLVVLNLSNNRFSGTIPDLFEFHTSLESLQLGKNKLYGFIPPSLKYCRQLRVLDLSDNKLYGKIPSWIGGKLSLLTILSLRSNSLTGQIPTELSYLTSLQILDLSQNNISGNFSLYFQNFTVMTAASKIYIDTFIDIEIDIEGGPYSESLWLNKGIPRLYTSTLNDAIVIDISSNNLSGEISNEIAELVGLIFLNISRNHFIGSIPKNIGAMKNIERLDLSSNDLSGEIPSTMTEMTSLSVLNLSNNKLSGKIPSGNQFGSFDDPSIYNGNTNLCGWPLPKCPMPKNNINESDSEEIKEHEYWYETKWINAGTAIGFLISFWGFYIVLILNRAVRDWYFYYVDILYECIALKFDLIIARIKCKVTEIEMHQMQPNE